MEMLSYVFSGHERKGAGVRPKGYAFLALILIVPPAMGAVISPSPTPSVALNTQTSAISESEFAALPAYELERIPSAQTEKSQAIRVGDRVELKVLGLSPVSGNPNWKLEIPSGSPSLSDQGWALLEEQNSAEYRFLAVPLKAGELILSSVGLKNGEGKAFARTNPFKLNVISAIRPDDPKPQEPSPLRPPVSLVFPLWVYILFGIFSLAGLSYGIYRLICWSRRNKKVIAVEPSAPQITEDEAALAALVEVERQDLIRHGNFKKYYFRISEILKVYIGRRFGFDAPESTSREILTVLRKQKVDELQRLELLFEKLDLVKFTDHRPDLEEAPVILSETRDFVMSTRRVKIGVQSGVPTP